MAPVTVITIVPHLGTWDDVEVDLGILRFRPFPREGRPLPDELRVHLERIGKGFGLDYPFLYAINTLDLWDAFEGFEMSSSRAYVLLQYALLANQIDSHTTPISYEHTQRYAVVPDGHGYIVFKDGRGAAILNRGLTPTARSQTTVPRQARGRFLPSGACLR